MTRDYDALLLDLDGTLVGALDAIRPRTRAALEAARERGVRVMIVTGRSEQATIPVVEDLGLDTPAVVYNGAAVWSPTERRLVEERTLSNRTRDRSIDFGLDRDLVVAVMCAGAKYAVEPRNEEERFALRWMTDLRIVPPAELRRDRAIRVTLFSNGHGSSEQFAIELERAVDQPMYTTHFPMSVLPTHRDSELAVVDVHPPCLGKGEALRLCEELYGIPPGRVVAVGDATNDLPMLEPAGLGVAVADGMPEVLERADLVIGPRDSDGLAELVERLFLAD